MSDDVDEAPVAQAEAKEPTTAEANATAESDSKPAAGGDAQAPIVLEEEIDPNYVPTEDEILEYAKWLGMDPEQDKDLFYIAKEGLKAPLPKDWKPCKDTADSDESAFALRAGRRHGQEEDQRAGARCTPQDNPGFLQNAQRTAHAGHVHKNATPWC